MNMRLFLRQLIGQQPLTDFINAAARTLQLYDTLAWEQAHRLVWEAIDAGDPVVLAAAGQVWVRRDDWYVDDTPGPRLHIVQRTHQGVFAVVEPEVESHDTLTRQTPPWDEDHADDLAFSALEAYCLESWTVPEHFLPGCCHIQSAGRRDEP